MVIIRQKIRRILNIDALEKAAKAVGFKRVQVVQFANMPLKDQMTLAANCRVMVGVHGAGQQWAIFMPPGSTLIEISWQYWPPSYGFVRTYDIQNINLIASHAQVIGQNLKPSHAMGKNVRTKSN